MKCPTCQREFASAEQKVQLSHFPTNIEFCWSQGNANCLLFATCNTLASALQSVLTVTKDDDGTYRSPENQMRIRTAAAILEHVMGPPPRVTTVRRTTSPPEVCNEEK